MKTISEIHNSKHKAITVFFGDHIRGYLMLKRNSKNLSKVNNIIMHKYMGYSNINWNTCKYMLNFSAKPNKSMIISTNIDIPKESSVKDKETNKYF